MRKIIRPKEISIMYPVGTYMLKNSYNIKMMANNIAGFISNIKTVAFWARGSSGTIISTVIAGELENPDMIINYVKKDDESNHHIKMHTKIDKDLNIIVDDFISTGDTLVSILSEMLVAGVTPDVICMSGGFYEDHENLLIGEFGEEFFENTIFIFNEFV